MSQIEMGDKITPWRELGLPRSSLRDANAWMVWLVFAIGLSLVINHEFNFGLHSVVHIYRGASLAWLAGEPLYDLHTIHGFLYLPSSAALTVPLAIPPAWAQEFAWRWLSIGLLAVAAWRLSRAVRPVSDSATRTGQNLFLIMTLVIIPVSVGSARPGQMNLVLAATMALATAEGLERRWWRAAFWLGLGFALKPQALVLALVMAAICRPLRWRIGLAILAALAVPFLLQRPDYVVEQYRQCWQKMALSGNPEQVGAVFNDLFGLLGALRMDVAERGQWIIRLAAAPLTLALCRQAMRRGDRVHGMMAMLGLSAAYLMLFNPRTEGGSYIVAGVPLAVYAAWAIERSSRRREAAVLLAIALGWTISYDLSLRLWDAARWAGMLNQRADFHAGYGSYWLSPLLGVYFYCYMAYNAMESGDSRERGTEKAAEAVSYGDGVTEAAPARG